MRGLPWWLCIALLFLSRPAAAQRADNPHGASVQGNTCNACHRADGWRPAVIGKDFRHAPQSFPLDGAHAKTTCTSCCRGIPNCAAKAWTGACGSTRSGTRRTPR